jgi:hypothetical protein
MRRAVRTLALIAALAVAGCRDPYAGTRTAPATPSPREDAARAAASAREAARLFATRWANWDWHSAGRQQLALAGLAVGGLARELKANADSARVDATLARDRSGSRGTVAAIDLQPRRQVAAGLVVTHEQSLTNGHVDLGGARYRVYLVRLVHDHARWEVTTWEPQP